MFKLESSGLGRIYVAPELPRGCALFYTTRDFPGYFDAAAIEGLVGLMRERFHVNANLASCSQVHGAEALSVSSAGGWREYASCDALFTAQNGLALGIKVADCLPVTLIDSDHSVIANVHSGWRGCVSEIVDRTLDKLAAETSFDPGSARAYLGPSIRVCCFEVGEDVVESVKETYGQIEGTIDRSRGPKPHVDLARLTRLRLESRGFDAERIIDSQLCTRCEGSLFHSFRRDGKSAGRNLAIVAQ